MFINVYLYNYNIVYVYGFDLMPTVTISIPKDLKDEMKKYPEINWPELIKQRLKVRAKALYEFEQKQKKMRM